MLRACLSWKSGRAVDEFPDDPESGAVHGRGHRSPQPRRRHGVRRCSARGLRDFSLGSIKRIRRRRQPAAPPQAAEPLTILYATESGNSERLANEAAKAARKQGFKPTRRRHGRSRTCDACESQTSDRDRGHLGRGRAARPRCARLCRTDGRKRAEARRRRIRRTRARRFRLCGFLHHRPEDRRSTRGPRRQTRRGSRRLRSRL